MATSAEDKRTQAADVLSALEPTDAMDPLLEHGRGGWSRWLLPGLLLLIIVGLAAAGSAKLAGTFASATSSRLLTHTVGKGELLITITEDGNLESANNQDVKCEVAGGSTILWIVEDGKMVAKGEELVRLDAAQLEEQISQQKITYEKARAAYIQAEKDYNVAKISVSEYLEGTYRKEIQDMEAQITIAMENLRSAENSLKHTQRMFRKGYVSPLQRETQEFAVQRAQLELDSAQTAKEVLEKFTKLKTLEDLQSKRDTAEAKKNSEKAAFDLEEARLKRLTAQIEKCVIRAPQAGMAVYANPTGRHRFGSSQQSQIEEGAPLHEQQAIFRLPDLSRMQVKVAVHESKVDQLSPGMRARIRIQDEEYFGTVESIANQPEAGSFFSANVKEYATIVKIDGEQERIKPGMTAEAEILVAHLKDVVTLPVAAVVQQRGKYYCWVKTQKEPERRPLVLGLSNDEFVEVKDGVVPGEEVVLNPRAVVAEAREEDSQGQEEVDVEKRFGGPSPDISAEDGPPGSQGDRVGPPGRQGPGGPDGGREGRGSPGGGRGLGARGGGGLMQMDQDGDGKVSRDEAPERMREFFDRIDGNGDGFIDAAEIGAMRDRSERGGGRPEGGPPGERPTRGGSP